MSIEKVTIIIPTFNASNTLRAALDSVKNQTFQNWECIVIDGASKDNTLEIVQSYVIEDSRFSYISEPDNGIFDAMNKGWKLAKGEWIMYLGADDEFLLDAVENLMKFSSKNDIVYGNTLLKFATYSKLQISKSYHELKYEMCCCHQSIMVKNKIFVSLNGFDLSYKVCADYDLVLRAYLTGYKFYQIDKTIAIFNMGGLSSDNIEAIKELYKIKKINKSIRFPFLHYQYQKLYCRLLIVKHKIIT